MAKPKKLIAEKNLSGLGGVADVSFGDATPERRAQRDFSKEGIPEPNHDAFDDYNERMERWDSGKFGILTNR
jgi:hypothetical protein